MIGLDIQGEIMKNLKLNDNTKLFHGSKGGIIGELSVVSPNKSRDKNPSDFGDGFYLGTNINQAKGVCIEHPEPVLYEMRVKFSEIPEDKILVLNNEQWLYTVLACRKKSQVFSSLELAEEIINLINGYDIVIGTIADDRMNDAINEFNDGGLSDKGLENCLNYIDYGMQVVIKTKRINDIVQIVNEKRIFGAEADEVREHMYQDRKKSRNIVKEMKSKYRREGLYIDEIEEMAKEGKIRVEDLF